MASIIIVIDRLASMIAFVRVIYYLQFLTLALRINRDPNFLIFDRLQFHLTDSHHLDQIPYGQSCHG